MGSFLEKIINYHLPLFSKGSSFRETDPG